MRAPTRRELRAQARALDEMLATFVDLKARRIAREMGLSIGEVRRAMHRGCEERMREFANDHTEALAA